MYYLIPAIALLVVALAVWALIRGGTRAETATRARMTRARSTDASITQIAASPMQEGNRLRAAVHVTLVVAGCGHGPSEAHGFWVIDSARVSELQIGRRVPVKIDADDAEVAYPDLPGVEHDIGNHAIWRNEKAHPRG